MRFGVGKISSVSDGTFDFYSYVSLISAIDKLAPVYIFVYRRKKPDGTLVNYAEKIVRYDSSTKRKSVSITHKDYNASWNEQKEEKLHSVYSFADFAGYGNERRKKRDLAAFLANISHETTGLGNGDANKNSGLYWREEAAWQQGSTEIHYTSSGNPMFIAEPGKSYHGRGPIQISYPYNYGQVSQFLFGDKDVLLKTPELVLTSDSNNDGTPDANVAFQTAIWFWMTPQGISHPVMRL